MNTGAAVFVVSLALVLGFILLGVFVPEQLDQFSSVLHGGIIEHFGWAYLLAAFGFVVFSLYLALSKYGRLKLGRPNDKPQYSYFGWFSMLFAAGMGIGLIFWGVSEPLSHFANPPQYLDSASGEAARFAMVRSYFHWGIQPWAIYIVMSLSIAYFSFRRGMAPLISNTFYPLIGDRVFGWPGKLIDILAVFATVFGIVTSLGLGALQINGGLGAVFGLPISAMWVVAAAEAGVGWGLVICVTVLRSFRLVGDDDPGGVGLADGELVAVELDGDRVAQRGAAANADRRPRQQAHRHEPLRRLGRAVDPLHAAALAGFELVQGSGQGRAPACRPVRRVVRGSSGHGSHLFGPFGFAA